MLFDENGNPRFYDYPSTVCQTKMPDPEVKRIFEAMRELLKQYQITCFVPRASTAAHPPEEAVVEHANWLLSAKVEEATTSKLTFVQVKNRTSTNTQTVFRYITPIGLQEELDDPGNCEG